MRSRSLVASLSLLLSAIPACGGSDEPVIDPGDGGNYTVALDPARFVATIDNPWLPLVPGSRWVYEEGDERIEVVVTDDTRVVMGSRPRWSGTR